MPSIDHKDRPIDQQSSPHEPVTPSGEGATLSLYAEEQTTRELAKLAGLPQLGSIPAEPEPAHAVANTAVDTLVDEGGWRAPHEMDQGEEPDQRDDSGPGEPLREATRSTTEAKSSDNHDGGGDDGEEAELTVRDPDASSGAESAAGDGSDEGGDGTDDSPERGDEYSERYSPEDIAGFLRENRVVLQGVSPEVHAQNLEIVEALRETAIESGDDTLGVQLLGSRANGTSDLRSDVDGVVIMFASGNADETRRPFEQAVEDRTGVGGEDFHEVARSALIADDIPEDPEEFIQLIEDGVSSADELPIGLFDDGIYASDDLRLVRLAAVEVIRSYPPDDVEQNWTFIRAAHAANYLAVGDTERVREKLTERLGPGQDGTIRRVITRELMTGRERFSLPWDIDAYHQTLHQWATDNEARLADSRGYRLLQAVRGAL